MVNDALFPQTPLLLNNNGAWCWFQDERALVDPANNTLLLGSVASPDGPKGAEGAETLKSRSWISPPARAASTCFTTAWSPMTTMPRPS